ncbi:MAG: hypothetical protein PHW73_12450 [Atribacterota bacterium]|nr:hypothetical protein [Atribacterota bacterium]
MPNTPSVSKLLIRIDERVKKIMSEMREIKHCLESTVKNDEEYREIKTKVERLWDDRNRMIGWMLGAGLVGGTTGSIFKSLVETVLAK